MAERSQVPDSRLQTFSAEIEYSVSFVISKMLMTVSFSYFPYLRFITKEKSGRIPIIVRMAEFSKAPDSRLRN